MHRVNISAILQQVEKYQKSTLKLQNKVQSLWLRPKNSALLALVVQML
jgi:hypothetical protein